MRDLPIPGSPESNTTWPSPFLARSHRRNRNSSSSPRPTSGVGEDARNASNRLATLLGRTTCQADTVPAKPRYPTATGAGDEKRLPATPLPGTPFRHRRLGPEPAPAGFQVQSGGSPASRFASCLAHLASRVLAGAKTAPEDRSRLKPPVGNA